MGNRQEMHVSISISGDTKHAWQGSKGSVTLNGFHYFPPDAVIPLHNGDKTEYVRIIDVHKYGIGYTTIQYEHARQPKRPLQEIPVEFNWILKLRDVEGNLEELLAKEKGLVFVKENDPVYRDFPIDIPIELWRYPRPKENVRAVALAKIKINELIIGYGKTAGSYDVLKVFNPQEREMMNKNFL